MCVMFEFELQKMKTHVSIFNGNANLRRQARVSFVESSRRVTEERQYNNVAREFHIIAA